MPSFSSGLVAGLPNSALMSKTFFSVLLHGSAEIPLSTGVLINSISMSSLTLFGLPPSNGTCPPVCAMAASFMFLFFFFFFFAHMLVVSG